MRAKKKKVDPEREAKRRAAASAREEAKKKAAEQRQKGAEAADGGERPEKSAQAPASIDYSTCTIKELKTYLSERQLPTSGRKGELIERLTSAMGGDAEEPSSEAPAAIEERPEKNAQAPASVDYSTCTIKELKTYLSERQLPTSGRKGELIERLTSALGGDAEEPSSEAPAAIEEDKGSTAAEELQALSVADLRSRLRSLGLAVAGRKAELVERIQNSGGREHDSEDAAATATSKSVTFEVGDFAEAENGGEWFKGKVTVAHSDDVFTIQGDDGDELEFEASAMRLRQDKIRFDRLRVGQRYRGKVTRLIPIGAFVDIGTDRPGLVRRSRMADRYVEQAEDVVKLGEEVDVWVYRLPGDGKLGLSLLEVPPSDLRDPLTAFENLDKDELLDGTIKFEGPNGFYVDVQLPSGQGVAQGLLRKYRAARGDKVGAEVKLRVVQMMVNSGTLELATKA